MQTVVDEISRVPSTSDSAPVLRTIDLLLRDTPALLARIRQGRDLAGLARASILTIAVCGAVFGAAMGAHRGGLQILYAALKLPAAMLLTTAVCAPALTALQAAFRRGSSMRQDLALVLGSLALTCLVLAAEAPVVLLAVQLHASYHTAILLVVACCTLAGLVGVSWFIRGLGLDPSPGRWIVAASLLAVFCVVGAQMSWTLRPFLLRPRTPDTPFLRSLEGSFVEAVITSTRSARGLYSRSHAPLPGEWEEP
jgi:hypothetical protein